MGIENIDFDSFEFGGHHIGYNVPILSSTTRRMYMSILPNSVQGDAKYDADREIAGSIRRIEQVGRTFPQEVFNDISGSLKEDAANYAYGFLEKSLRPNSVDIIYLVENEGSLGISKALVSAKKYPGFTEVPIVLVYENGVPIVAALGKSDSSEIVTCQAELESLDKMFAGNFLPALSKMSMSFFEHDGLGAFREVSVRPACAFRPKR